MTRPVRFVRIRYPELAVVRFEWRRAKRVLEPLLDRVPEPEWWWDRRMGVRFLGSAFWHPERHAPALALLRDVRLRGVHVPSIPKWSRMPFIVLNQGMQNLESEFGAEKAQEIFLGVVRHELAHLARGAYGHDRKFRSALKQLEAESSDAPRARSSSR